MVLKPSENRSSYDAFLFQYDFSQEDVELYQNGQPIPNQQEKTQITYLPDFDETPLYNARVGENGAPPFEAPSGCAWELIDYDFASDGYYWEAIHYWQLNCNGGGSSSSSGDGSSNGDGGWTGNGNTGTSPGDSNSNGNQNGGGNGNGGTRSVSPIVTTPVGLDGVAIKDPCINAAQANQKSKNILNEPAFQQKLNQINGTIPTDTVEKGFTFGIRPEDNNFAVSEVQTGTATGINLPSTNPNFNVTGNIHTHPAIGFDSFSPSDFYGFTTANTANSNFSTMFVLGATGEVYSLTITDPVRFTNFTTFYPMTDHFDPAINGWKKGSPIRDDFMGAFDNLYREQGKTTDEAYALANAYVLRKYNAGMSISKKNSNGDFETLFVEEKKDPNDNTKTIYEQTSICNLKKK